MYGVALFALLFTSLVVAQEVLVENSSAFARVTTTGTTTANFQVQTTKGNYGTVLQTQATRVDLEADLLAVSVKPLANKALSFTGATGASFSSTAGDANVSSNDRHVLTIASTEVINATPSNTTFTGFVHTKMVSAATGDLALRGALDVNVSAGTADDTKEYSFLYNNALGHTLKKDVVTSAGALSLVSDKGDVKVSTTGTAKTLSFESSNGNAKLIFAATGVSIIGLQDATATTKADAMNASAGNKLVFSGENINVVATTGDVVFGSEVVIAKTKSVKSDGDTNLLLSAPTSKKIIFQNDAANTASLEATKLSLAPKAKLTSAAALSFATGASGNLVLSSGSAAAKTTVSVEGTSAYTFTGGADGLQFNLPLTFPSTTGVTTFSGVTTVTGLATFEDSLTVGPSITGTGTDALSIEAVNELKIQSRVGGGKTTFGTNVASVFVEPTGVTFDQPATMSAAVKVQGPLNITATSVTVLAGKSISGAGALEYKSTAALTLSAANAAAKVDLKIDGTSVAFAGTTVTFQGTAGFTTTTGTTNVVAALNAQGETDLKKNSTFSVIQGSPVDIASSAVLEVDSATGVNIGNTALPAAIAVTTTAINIGAIKTTFEKGIAPGDGLDLEGASAMTALKGLTLSSAAAGDFSVNTKTTMVFNHNTATYMDVSATGLDVKADYAVTFAKKVTAGAGGVSVGSGEQWVSNGVVTLTGGAVATINDINIGTTATSVITAKTSGTGAATIGNPKDFVSVSSTGTEISNTANSVAFTGAATFSSTLTVTGGMGVNSLAYEGNNITITGGELKIDATIAGAALKIGSNSLDEMLFQDTTATNGITFSKAVAQVVKLKEGNFDARTLVTDGLVIGTIKFKGLQGQVKTLATAVAVTANIPKLVATGAAAGGTVCYGNVRATGNFVTSCSTGGGTPKVAVLSPTTFSVPAGDMNIVNVLLE